MNHLNGSRTKFAALIFCIALIASACGQKPNVHVRGVATQNAGNLDASGQTVDSNTGQPVAAGQTGGSATSGSSGGSTGGTTTTTKKGTSTAGTTGGTTAVGPNDKNGINESAHTITIGVHLPLTGAAAVPLTDIQFGLKIYSAWLEHATPAITVAGYKIIAEFRDDQYNPSTAQNVCRDLVENAKVFLLVGGAGADQIVTCARYAAQKGVPYLSAGVTEKTLKTLPNYFSFSETYPQQGKALAQMIKNFSGAPGGALYVDRCSDVGTGCGTAGSSDPKVAIIYSDTDGFYDGRDAFRTAAKSVGIAMGSDGKLAGGEYPIEKEDLQSSKADGIIQDLKKKGVDVVYPLTAPLNWVTLLQSAETNLYVPRWVGVGLTMGVGSVAKLGCSKSPQNFTNALFFNPYYSVYAHELNNPNITSKQFNEAWAAYSDDKSPANGHDIAFGLWGASIAEHAMFEYVGAPFGRAKFMQKLATAQNLTGPKVTRNGEKIIPVYGPLNYSSTNHLGSSTFHLLYGSCVSGNGTWKDVPGQQFVSGF